MNDDLNNILRASYNFLPECLEQNPSPDRYAGMDHNTGDWSFFIDNPDLLLIQSTNATEDYNQVQAHNFPYSADAVLTEEL